MKNTNSSVPAAAPVAASNVPVLIAFATIPEYVQAFQQLANQNAGKSPFRFFFWFRGKAPVEPLQFQLFHMQCVTGYTAIGTPVGSLIRTTVSGALQQGYLDSQLGLIVPPNVNRTQAWLNLVNTNAKTQLNLNSQLVLLQLDVFNPLVPTHNIKYQNPVSYNVPFEYNIV